MPNNLVIAGSNGGGETKGSRSAVGAGTGSRLSGSGSATAVASRSGIVVIDSSTAWSTLIFGKASRVFAAFVSFHYLQDKVALPLYLFFVGLGASIFLLGLQRPWTGRRIGSRRCKKVLVAGAVLACTLYIWTMGLRSAGPLRTMLIDGAELPLLYLFAVLSRRELPEKRRSRGAVLMLLAYALLIWDASGNVPNFKELESSNAKFLFRKHNNNAPNDKADINLDNIAFKRPIKEDDFTGDHSRKLQGYSSRKLLTTYKPPVEGSGKLKDAFIEGTALRSEIGVILVLIASVIMQSSRSFTRRLATELGGAKRHFALSISCATVWLAPLALLSSVSSAGGAFLSLSVKGGITKMNISPTHAFGFATVGFLWLVVPYYVRAIVSTRLSQNSMTRMNVVIPFIMAAAVSTFLGAAQTAGGVSWILFVAFVLNFTGISLMMSPSSKRSLSELPIDSGNSTVETSRSVSNAQ